MEEMQRARCGERQGTSLQSQSMPLSQYLHVFTTQKPHLTLITPLYIQLQRNIQLLLLFFQMITLRNRCLSNCPKSLTSKCQSWDLKWSSHHGQQKVKNAVLGCNLKNDRMISVCFQGKPFNITVIQAYAPTSNTEEAEVERFHEDLQDLLELTPKKDVLFIIGDWNQKQEVKKHLE